MDLANPSMASSGTLDFGMGVEVAEGPGNLAAILVLGAGVVGMVSLKVDGSSGLTSWVGGWLKDIMKLVLAEHQCAVYKNINRFRF